MWCPPRCDNDSSVGGDGSGHSSHGSTGSNHNSGGGNVKSCAINKIDLEYKFSIWWLNGMLDQLCGATIISEISLSSGYHHI